MTVLLDEIMVTVPSMDDTDPSVATPREFMGFTFNEALRIRWLLENFEKIRKLMDDIQHCKKCPFIHGGTIDCVEVGHESKSE